MSRLRQTEIEINRCKGYCSDIFGVIMLLMNIARSLAMIVDMLKDGDTE